MSCSGGSCSCGKGMLSTHDWMKGLENLTIDEEVVEVRFKNNRKGFYRNPHGLIIVKDLSKNHPG